VVICLGFHPDLTPAISSDREETGQAGDMSTLLPLLMPQQQKAAIAGASSAKMFGEISQIRGLCSRLPDLSRRLEGAAHAGKNP
jgi:hypothetical protein